MRLFTQNKKIIQNEGICCLLSAFQKIIIKSNLLSSLQITLFKNCNSHLKTLTSNFPYQIRSELATCGICSSYRVSKTRPFYHYRSWLLLLLINAFRCSAILTEGKTKTLLELLNLLQAESSNSWGKCLHIQICWKWTAMDSKKILSP